MFEPHEPLPAHRPRIRYFNEDKLRNPDRLWSRLRAGLRAQRHRRIVAELPPELTWKDIRKSRRKIQEDVAGALGVRQDRVSRIERLPNPRLGLLRAYAEALGGQLHLVVRFPDRDYRLKL